MDILVSKVDALGLYLRFDLGPIVSFSDYDWGGVYYNASMVTSAESRRGVAFELCHGEGMRWEFLASSLNIHPASFRALVEPVLATLGWEYTALRGQ